MSAPIVVDGWEIKKYRDGIWYALRNGDVDRSLYIRGGIVWSLETRIPLSVIEKLKELEANGEQD